MESNPLTMERAIEIQLQQLEEWRSKLNEECYFDLKEKANLSNQLVTSPYGVFRGSDMSNFIANWKPKR